MAHNHINFYSCHKQYMFPHGCAVWFLSFLSSDISTLVMQTLDGFRQGFLWCLLFIYSPVYHCCALSEYYYSSLAWASDISTICVWVHRACFTNSQSCLVAICLTANCPGEFREVISVWWGIARFPGHGVTGQLKHFI